MVQKCRKRRSAKVARIGISRLDAQILGDLDAAFLAHVVDEEAVDVGKSQPCLFERLGRRRHRHRKLCLVANLAEC